MVYVPRSEFVGTCINVTVTVPPKTLLPQDRCVRQKEVMCPKNNLSKNRYMYLKIDKLINGFNIIFSCVRKNHREKIKN